MFTITIRLISFFGKENPEKDEILSIEGRKGITTKLSDADMAVTSDYMSTGSVLGELALLTGKAVNIYRFTI